MGVGPPLSWSGPSSGLSRLLVEPVWSCEPGKPKPVLPLVAPIRLYPMELKGPRTSLGEPAAMFPAMIELAMILVY